MSGPERLLDVARHAHVRLEILLNLQSLGRVILKRYVGLLPVCLFLLRKNPGVGERRFQEYRDRHYACCYVDEHVPGTYFVAARRRDQNGRRDWHEQKNDVRNNGARKGRAYDAVFFVDCFRVEWER